MAPRPRGFFFSLMTKRIDVSNGLGTVLYSDFSPACYRGFLFLMWFSRYIESPSSVITSYLCGVAALIHWGGGDHSNSHFFNLRI